MGTDQIKRPPKQLIFVCVQEGGCEARGTAYNFGEEVSVSEKFVLKEQALGRHPDTGNSLSPLINHFRSDRQAVRDAIHDEQDPKRVVPDDLDDGKFYVSMSAIGTKLRKRYTEGTWKPEDEPEKMAGFGDTAEIPDGKFPGDGPDEEEEEKGGDVDQTTDKLPETEAPQSRAPRGPDDSEPGPSYNMEMLKSALIQACKDRGVEYNSGDTKADLIIKLS